MNEEEVYYFTSLQFINKKYSLKLGYNRLI